MDKPGRNEPCYCGSGKKYKQCHMKEDLAAEKEDRAWKDAVRTLSVALFDFADEERFAEAREQTIPVYWDGLYQADSAAQMSPSEDARFYDWFVYDYPLPDESNQRLIDLFAAEAGPALADRRRQLLDQWQAAGPLTVYELTGFEGQTLHLRDALTGESVEVFEPGGHMNAPEGSLFAGRVLPVNQRLEFSTLPLVIPTDETGDLLEKMRAAVEECAAEDKPANQEACLRQQTLLIVHHALEQAQTAGRPPVARLDPQYDPSTVPQREGHDRVRVQGPRAGAGTRQQLTSTRRKAI